MFKRSCHYSTEWARNDSKELNLEVFQRFFAKTMTASRMYSLY